MRMPPSAPLQDLPYLEGVPRHAANVRTGHGKRASPLPFQSMKSSHLLSRPTARSLVQGPPYPSRSLDMPCGRSFRIRSLPSPSRLFSSHLLGPVLVILACLLIRPAAAVLIPFDNCLPDSYRNYDPLPLQWNPLYVDARFDTDDPGHNLQIIVWGNVSGSYKTVELPAATNESYWDNPELTDGKLLDFTNPDFKVTTLSSKVNVLTYEPFGNFSSFCNYSLVNGSCPLSPVFNSTAM